MIDFTAAHNARTYSGRRAHPSWSAHVTGLVDPRGAVVVDLGCGGGIYSRAWRELGAERVIGVDSSAPILASATAEHGADPQITFHRGDATATGLPEACADVVFSRALVHHLPDLRAFAEEARRLLRPGGTLIVQDRTVEDVSQPADVDLAAAELAAPDLTAAHLTAAALPGDARHVRGWFFEAFPRLLQVEAARRPGAQELTEALEEAGVHVEVSTLWEVRAEHPDRESLLADVAARTGRSILHELDDAELARLVDVLRAQLPEGGVTEVDRWTLWMARTPDGTSSGHR